jgi:hypothetical protein
MGEPRCPPLWGGRSFIVIYAWGPKSWSPGLLWAPWLIWAVPASQDVPRATLGLAVSSGASVSMGQPVTMSVGPAPAQLAGEEASVSEVSQTQAGGGPEGP